ncbi:MAG: ribosome biogenesis GTPase Der [Pseudomonadota bacterium]
MAFTLAIIGRPNVGKSTLFNRLVGKRLALVDDQPGVTRDLREGDARLGDLRFTVIDTAGLEEADAGSLSGRMRALSEQAVAMADAVLFLTDARAGLLPQDRAFADLLRRRGADVILGVNKAEGSQGEAAALDAYSLGLGEPVALSAEHGEGMAELYAALLPRVEAVAPGDVDAEDSERPLQVAVLGRPNAGKSTLVNRLLGQDRMLTGPEAGITRDAISVELDWLGQPARVFDTAGVRKRPKVQEKLEKLAVSDGLRAVRFAEVVILLLDQQNPFETQDLRLADLAEREGRAVLVAVNKWDVAEDRQKRLKALQEEFERLLPQLKGAPLVAISAKTGQGLDRLKQAVLDLREVWNTRVSTSRLNDWLYEMTSAHPPPAPGGRRIRLRYMTQAKARPPTFIVFCSRPEDLPESYKRFLVNGLRRDFGLEGTPIRLDWRKGDNPYEAKAGRRGRKARLANKKS